MPKRLQLLVLAVALAACAAPTATVTPTPTAAITPLPATTPTESPPPFKVEVAEGVSRQDVDIGLRGIALARAFLRESLGDDIPEEVLRTVSFEFVTVGQSQDYGTTSYINVSEAGWYTVRDVRLPSPLSREVVPLQISARAYIYQWQRTLGCRGSVETGPLGFWTQEGMADYLAWQAVVAAGYITDEAVRVGTATLGKAWPLHASLRALERGISFGSRPGNYAIAHLAVDDLVKESPYGLLSLRLLCEQEPSEQIFSESFRTKFGITPDAFYERFDQKLLIWYGTLLAGGVVDAKGNPLVNLRVEVCRRGENFSLCNQSTLTSPDGRYAFLLQSGVYYLGIDPDNNVFTDDGYYYTIGSPGITPFRSRATPIVVTNEPITGINLQLLFASNISGIAGTYKATSSFAAPLQYVWACSEDDTSECRRSWYVFPDWFGSYSIRTPAGRYYLRAFCSGAGEGWVSEAKGFSHMQETASLVTVVEGKITNIDIQCP